MVDLFRYKHWDLVSKRGIYFIISAVVILIGLVALFKQGLNLGIDFKGGGLAAYRVDGSLPASKHAVVIRDIRTALTQEDIESEVQISPSAVAGSGDQIIIRTMLKTDDESAKAGMHVEQINSAITPTVLKVLETNGKKLAAEQVETTEGEDGKETTVVTPEQQDVVTASVQQELVLNGVIALVLGSFFIVLWIAFRYNIGGFGFRYSAASIIALLHDLLILVGMFAIMRNFLQVNSPFIAALLTVLGYSIHDTIVIFDRIRENIRLRKGRTFAETVNISLLETMARSVNTVLTVLFTLLALFFFGGPTLRDFTAAMLIGMVAGAYSSIFIASQLLVSWSKGKERVILPAGEVVTPAAAPVAAPQPVMAGASSELVSTASPSPAVSQDAIQRARQAGKTSAGKTARRRR